LPRPTLTGNGDGRSGVTFTRPGPHVMPQPVALRTASLRTQRAAASVMAAVSASPSCRATRSRP
jgi:hypothetical protein